MKDFSNAFGSVELPKQQSAGTGSASNQPKIDYDKFNAKQLELLGGEGKHDFIGVITNAYDLGTQEQDEQTVPVNDSEYSKHEWRLEKWEDSGEPKDPTAKIVTKRFKNVEQECLVYTPQPVKQIAIAVDLPEVMFPYGEFYEGSSDKPFRIILGEHGFKTKKKVEKVGNQNFIAKPFNLKHVNVNRGKDGVKPHYALAKNHKLVGMAEMADVLDQDGNFHAQEVGKLIGKPFNLKVIVEHKKWDGGSRLEVSATVESKLSVRDMKYYQEDLEPKLTEDLFGFVLFNGENNTDTLKTLKGCIVNSMKLSPDFDNSEIKGQLEDARGSYSSLQASQQASKPSEGNQSSAESKPVQEAAVNANTTSNASAPVDSLPNLDDELDDIPF